MKESEKKYFKKLIDNRDFTSAKAYLKKVVIRNNISSLIENYYFSQP